METVALDLHSGILWSKLAVLGVARRSGLEAP